VGDAYEAFRNGLASDVRPWQPEWEEALEIIREDGFLDYPSCHLRFAVRQVNVVP
jgi:hypothetical protein